MMSFSIFRGFSISLFSILLHDLLDLLQSTDRMPWWPVSNWQIGHGLNVIPTGPLKEVLLFGLIFAVFLACRHLQAKRNKKRKVKPTIHYSRSRFVWISRGAIAVIILAAVFTHYMRDTRERQLYNAHSLLKSKDYVGILNTLKKAERWPSIAKPGRIDYLRGVAYMKQHKTELAEKYLLRSYSLNQNYFWCVADLALVYASSDRAPQIRASLAAPYIKQLQKQFPKHVDFSKCMNKIQHHLAAS